jgi:hypothetical protein
VEHQRTPSSTSRVARKRASRARTRRTCTSKVCSLRPSRVAIPGVGEVLGNRRQHRELAPSVRRGARAGAGRAGTHRPPAILRSRAGECWDAVGSWPVSRRRGACFYRTRRSCGGFRWGGRSLRRRSRWHGRGAARRESVPCNPPPGPTGTSPHREEITTQHEAREEGRSRSRAPNTCRSSGWLTPGSGFPTGAHGVGQRGVPRKHPVEVMALGNRLIHHPSRQFAKNPSIAS